MTSKSYKNTAVSRKTKWKSPAEGDHGKKAVQHYVDTLTPADVRKSTHDVTRDGKTGRPEAKTPSHRNRGATANFARHPRVEIPDAVSFEGREYLLFRQGTRYKWVAVDKFAFDDKAGLRELKAAGIVAFGAKATRELIEDIGEQTDFRSAVVVDRFGWTQGHFTRLDGTIFAPRGEDTPPVVILTQAARVASCGSPVSWRRQVAGLFVGHPIGEFLLCAAFAAPLIGLLGLNGNAGIGVVGASSTGKSTLLLAAASAYGPASDNIGHYRHTFNATVNALDQQMPLYRDALFVVDELGFMDTPVTTRSAQSLFDFVLRSSQGHSKRRMSDEVGNTLVNNLVFMTSANKSLTEALAPLGQASIEAALVRLSMVPVPDRPTGVFEHVPAGYDNVPDALEALQQALRQHHGVAMPRYLGRLVQHRAESPRELVDGLRRRMTAFTEMVRGDTVAGQDERIIRVFALVAAAGDLAKRYRVLPSGFTPAQSAVACYRLLRDQQQRQSRPTTIAERLVAWLGQNAFYDLRTSEPPSLSDQAFAATGAFVALGVRGRLEVQLAEPVFRRIFPDYARVLNSPEAVGMMRKDRNTFQTKRTVRHAHTPERVYCFVLPHDAI